MIKKLFPTILPILFIFLLKIQIANAAGIFAYIPNSAYNTVSIIDTATNTVVETVSVGIAPTGVAITPDGRKVYVTNVNSNDISVIDASTNVVINKSVAVGAKPSGVAITPDGRKIYVANFNSDDVSIIHVST